MQSMKGYSIWRRGIICVIVVQMLLSLFLFKLGVTSNAWMQGSGDEGTKRNYECENGMVQYHVHGCLLRGVSLAIVALEALLSKEEDCLKYYYYFLMLWIFFLFVIRKFSTVDKILCNIQFQALWKQKGSIWSYFQTSLLPLIQFVQSIFIRQICTLMIFF